MTRSLITLLLTTACGSTAKGSRADGAVQVSAQKPVVTSLRVQPSQVTLAPGERFQLRALVTWSDGATIVPALLWTVERGDVSSKGQLTAPSTPGSYRVIATLESGTLADTTVMTVTQGPQPASPRRAAPPPAPQPPHASPPPAPPPAPSGAWKEPTGFSMITHRDFSSKAKTDADRGPTGSQGWDGIEYRYARITIAQDASAPLSPPSIMRMLYPAQTVKPNTTYSPGVAQMMGITTARAHYGELRHYRRLYFRTAFRVSANWQGHPSSTNKLFFVRSESGHEPIVRLRGAGPNALQLNVDLQGSRRDKRNIGAQASLGPNRGVDEANHIRRGKWYVLEGVLEIGTNGQSNGTLRLWLDGVLTHSYSDIEYEATAKRNDWGYIHIAPTWGGREGTINQLMWLDFDDFYVSGAP
jgi:hypothetical protein